MQKYALICRKKIASKVYKNMQNKNLQFSLFKYDIDKNPFTTCNCL